MQAGDPAAGHGDQHDIVVQAAPVVHSDGTSEMARITWRWPWAERGRGSADAKGAPAPDVVCPHCYKSMSEVV